MHGENLKFLLCVCNRCGKVEMSGLCFYFSNISLRISYLSLYLAFIYGRYKYVSDRTIKGTDSNTAKTAYI